MDKCFYFIRCPLPKNNTTFGFCKIPLKSIILLKQTLLLVKSINLFSVSTSCMNVTHIADIEQNIPPYFRRETEGLKETFQKRNI